MKKKQITTQENLVQRLVKLKASVKKGLLLKRKARLEHSPRPALHDLYSCDKPKWYILARSHSTLQGLHLPSTLILRNSSIPAYIYYSERNVEGGHNICESHRPAACFCAGNYSPIIYAPTVEGINESRKELKEGDFAFF